MVMETSSLVWIMIPVVLHGLTMAAQLLLAAYLLLHGLALVVKPHDVSPRLGRLGGLRPDGIDARAFGLLQLAAGALVLLPLAFGATWLISGVACLVALVLLLVYGRSHPQGRLVRTVAIAAAVSVLGFMAWERDDPATLAARILFKARDWRADELEWQLSNDRHSPKVGDLAPDFELQDPSGEKTIRLSAFFGKRPVALVFGSYT
jgi:hypothetical protein